MFNDPIGLSLVTLVLVLSVFTVGYFLGQITAKKGALGRITYRFFKMYPKPPAEGGHVDVQMLRIMKDYLAKQYFFDRLLIVPALIGLSIIAYVMYSVSEFYGICLAIASYFIFGVAANLGDFVWKGKAKTSFAYLFSKLSENKTTINDLPIKSGSMFLILADVQSAICGTQNELPLQREDSLEKFYRELAEHYSGDDVRNF